MKRREKPPVELRSERAEVPEAEQPGPCPKRLEAEVADCKPIAAGLTLRSTSSKC